MLRDVEGRITNYVAVFSDITASKREADRLHHQVNHDSLTRLPNRVLLQDRIEQALAHASRIGGDEFVILLPEVKSPGGAGCRLKASQDVADLLQ